MKKSRCTLYLFIFLKLTVCISQALSDEDISRLDSLLKPFDAEDKPGGYFIIRKDKEVWYEKAFGLADVANHVPIQKSTTFNIASLSKQFTARCIFHLEKQGLLSLSDPINDYLPEYGLDSSIHVNHLMSHSSGIWDYVAMMGMTLNLRERSMTSKNIESLIRQAGTPFFSAGTDHLYSNSGYFLLGQLVERVSGMSLRNFAAKNIFGPLGMDNTYFHDIKGESDAGKARGYSPKRSGKFRVDEWDEGVVGDHNLITSPEDLIKWADNFHSSHLGDNLEKLSSTLQEDRSSSAGFSVPYVGGLYRSRWNQLTVYGHGGRSNGFRCRMALIPQAGISVIFLTNSTASRPLDHFNYILELVLKCYEESSPLSSIVPLTTGIYMDNSSGSLLWLSDNGEQQYLLNGRTLLERYQGNKWRSPGSQFIEPYLDSIENVPMLNYYATHYEMTRYKLINDDLNSSLSWVDDEHLGRYENQNLGLRVKIKRKNDQLKLSYLRVEGKPLVRLVGWAFSFPLSTVKREFLYLPLGDVSIQYVTNTEGSYLTEGFFLTGQRFRNLFFKKL